MKRVLKIKSKIIIGIFLAVILQACSTYYMTTDSLHNQLNKINEKTVQEVYHFNIGIIPALVKGKQFSNWLNELEVTNKNGKKILLDVNEHTQMRITYKNGKRKVLLFDTVFARDSLVYGQQSRYLAMSIDPIKFSDIAKIEIQSPTGKKKNSQ